MLVSGAVTKSRGHEIVEAVEALVKNELFFRPELPLKLLRNPSRTVEHSCGILNTQFWDDLFFHQYSYPYRALVSSPRCDSLSQSGHFTSLRRLFAKILGQRGLHASARLEAGRSEPS